MRLASLIATTLTAALVAGCKTAPPSTPMPSNAPASKASASAQAGQPNAATKAAATKANLAIEKLRLSELFKGTPVLLALQPDGSLRVDVPLQFSFDAGKSVVKPPLAAVLDQVATGQRNELTSVVVRAPGDPATKAGTLIGERAASVRDRLVSHGLAESRVSVASSAVVGVVRIVVADMPQP
jgi:outer membrane protein OmpA-like peptidoglycan-associated protein